jgi:hypothetical protein
MSSVCFRLVIAWFAFARLLDSYLMRSHLTFFATLSTPALYRRTLRWFEASPCRAAPEDLPPSLMQHRSEGTIFYIVSSLRSWHTVVGEAFELRGPSASLASPVFRTILWLALPLLGPGEGDTQ